MFMRYNMKKLVLWLFVIMCVSFAIAGSILVTDGIDGVFGGNLGWQHDFDIFGKGRNADPNQVAGGGSVNDGSVGDGSVNEEKVFKADSLKDITVNTVSTDVKIIPVDGSEVKVHFYGSKSPSSKSEFPVLQTDLSGSRLAIDIKYSQSITIGISISRQAYKLDIYVPRSYKNNIKVATTSGDLDVTDLSLENFDFSTVSGNTKASALETSTSVFRTTSGDVKIDGFKGNLELKTVSGDARVTYTSFANSIKATTTSGDVSLTLPQNSEFKVAFKSVSGNIRNMFPVTTTGSVGKHDFEGFKGNSGNVIDIKTVSGDLDIKY